MPPAPKRWPEVQTRALSGAGEEASRRRLFRRLALLLVLGWPLAARLFRGTTGFNKHNNDFNMFCVAKSLLKPII